MKTQQNAKKKSDNNKQQKAKNKKNRKKKKETNKRKAVDLHVSLLLSGCLSRIQDNTEPGA